MKPTRPASLYSLLVRRLLWTGALALLLHLPLLIAFYLSDHEGLRQAAASKVVQQVKAAVQAAPEDPRARLAAIRPAGVALVVDGPQGRLRLGPPALVARVAAFTAHTRNVPKAMIDLNTDSGDVWVAVERFDHAGDPMAVHVGLRAITAGLRAGILKDEGIEHILLSVLPIVAALTAMAAWSLRRALQPLVKVSRAASELGARAGSATRLPVAGLPAEIARLVETVNAGLDRLDRAAARQRDFAAMAAHELRTPLARLKLRLSMLETPDAAEMTRQVDAITRLANQLLALARAEAVESVARMPVPLVPLARDLVADLAPLAVDNDKELAFVPPPDGGAPVIEGDPDTLGSALRNLIENALAYTPPGGLVEVRIGPGPRIEVADSGPGVPESAKATVFNRFQRGAAAMREAPHGAGLGLAIVGEVMHLHGGEARVADSDLGGAAFVLRFPGVDGPAPSIKTASPA